MHSQSNKIEGIYLDSVGIIVSKKEKQGPLGKYFKNYIDNYYFDCKTFEEAQAKLQNMAIKQCIKKSIYKNSNINIGFVGDLSNQIFASTFSVREEKFPVVGVYAACATGILSIILASIYINTFNLENALIATSSHLCVCEREFRYPNEYGLQSKDTSQKTVTAGVALILSKEKRSIKVSEFTIGKIVDSLSNNANDMGTIMAFAAIDTFITHLMNFHKKINDYDLIVTGDLARFGSKVFIEELKKKNIDIKDKYIDCGVIIYDDKQKVDAGGSGPGCVMAVTFSYVLNKLRNHECKNALIIATGALHSQISSQQKQSIPCVAHSILLEVE